MTGQSIKLGVDTQDAEQNLADLAKSMNDFLSEKGKAAGKTVRLLDVSKDLETLKELKKQFQELLAMSKQPGGVGHMVSLANGPVRPAVPSQINLAGVSSNGKEQSAAMERVLTRLLSHHLRTSSAPFQSNLTANDILGRPAQPAASVSAGVQPEPAQHAAPHAVPRQPDSPSGAGQAGKHVLGQALSGVGGNGGAAVGAGVSGAARGVAGMLPGGLVGGGLIGLAGYGAFKAAGSVSEGLDRAKDEAVELDVFKRMLGDLGVDFDGLRNSVRDASDGVGLSFGQTRKMFETFGRTADVRGKDFAAIGEETTNAASLSRATGIDPEAVARFMGEMRATKATGDIGDSRRMSLMIADAIKRSGGGINSDRLLESISNFAEHTKELSLGPANVSGYTGLLSGMVGSGLKAGTASGMLGTLDASIRNPQSEQADAFVYEAIQGNKLGYGNSMKLKQAGMFASTQSVFGDKKSPFYDPSMKDTDSTTTLDKFMAHMEKSFPGKDTQSKDYKLAATASFFGGNFAHAQQFTNSYEKHGSQGMSATSDMLKKMGVDPSELKMSGVTQVMEIANAKGGDELQKQRQGMLARKDLNSGQKEKLEAAGSVKDPESLRRALVDVAKTLDSEKTQGQELNDHAQKMSNDLQKIGTGLIPAVLISNDLLGALVDKLAPDTPMGRQRRAEREEKEKQEAVRQAQPEAIAKQDRGGLDPYLSKQLSDASQTPTMKAADSKLLKKAAPFVKDISAVESEFGLPAGLLAGSFAAESGFDPSDQNGKGMPASLGRRSKQDRTEFNAKFKTKYGRDIDETSQLDQMRASAMQLKENLDKAKGDETQALALQAGSSQLKPGRISSLGKPSDDIGIRRQAAEALRYKNLFNQGGVPPAAGLVGADNKLADPAELARRGRPPKTADTTELARRGRPPENADASDTAPSLVPQTASSLPKKAAERLDKTQLTPDQRAALEAATDGDKKKQGFLEDILKIENRGKSSPDDAATSPVGAAGAFQFMPPTAAAVGLKVGPGVDERRDFGKSAQAASRLYDDMHKRHGGNLEKMAADYNGGPKMARNAGNTGNPENDDYVRMFRHLQQQRAAAKDTPSKLASMTPESVLPAKAPAVPAAKTPAGMLDTSQPAVPKDSKIAKDAQLAKTDVAAPNPIMVPSGNPQQAAAAQAQAQAMQISLNGSVQANVNLLGQRGEDQGSVNLRVPLSGKPRAQGAPA